MIMLWSQRATALHPRLSIMMMLDDHHWKNSVVRSLWMQQVMVTEHHPRRHYHCRSSKTTGQHLQQRQFRTTKLDFRQNSCCPSSTAAVAPVSSAHSSNKRIQQQQQQRYQHNGSSLATKTTSQQGKSRKGKGKPPIKYMRILKCILSFAPIDLNHKGDDDEQDETQKDAKEEDGENSLLPQGRPIATTTTTTTTTTNQNDPQTINFKMRRKAFFKRHAKLFGHAPLTRKDFAKEMIQAVAHARAILRSQGASLGLISMSAVYCEFVLVLPLSQETTQSEEEDKKIRQEEEDDDDRGNKNDNKAPVIIENNSETTTQKAGDGGDGDENEEESNQSQQQQHQDEEQRNNHPQQQNVNDDKESSNPKRRKKSNNPKQPYDFDNDFWLQSMILDYEICSILRDRAEARLRMDQFRDEYVAIYGSEPPLLFQRERLFDSLRAVGSKAASGFNVELDPPGWYESSEDDERVWLTLSMDADGEDDNENENDVIGQPKEDMVRTQPEETQTRNKTGS